MEQWFVESLMAFSFALAMLFSVTKVVLTVLQRRAAPPTQLDDLRDRLARIEQTVEATAVEVERVAEAQRFTSRLLAERASGAPAPRPPHQVVTPH